MMPPTRSGYRATEAVGGGAGWDPANTRASDDLCAPGSWRVPLEHCRRLPPKEGLPDHGKPAAVLVPLHRKGAARHIHVGAAVPRSGPREKSVQNGSTEMPASGTKSDRCRRKTVALRPAQQGGRRSISNAPPSGGMRNGRPPAKGAVLFELRPW